MNPEDVNQKSTLVLILLLEKLAVSVFSLVPKVCKPGSANYLPEC